MTKFEMIQLLRTPMRTILFLLMIMASAILLSLGINLWAETDKKIQQYEENFMTIGTVEQVQTGTREERQWDAQEKKYRIYQRTQYGERIPVSVLDFKEAEYEIEPEFRPYYKAYVPEYKLSILENQVATNIMIVEAEPLYDCTPDHSVKIQIRKFLSSPPKGMREGDEIWFCNHSERNPKSMKAGHVYTLCLGIGNIVHGEEADRAGVAQSGINVYEYEPIPLVSTQTDSEGTGIQGPFVFENQDTNAYYEKTEDFYEGEMGNAFLELVEALPREAETLPVTGTNATKLLLPFYQKEAYVTQGRDITEKEYENGSKVCLVSLDFAKNNGLSIGDEIQLNLYGSVYGKSASVMSNGLHTEQLLNANGKAYEVFEEGEWEVVGIYDLPKSSLGTEYGLAPDEVIIPKKSIQESDKNNITSYSKMTGPTTSFSIPNGSIDSFMQKWSQEGIDDLNITFYDMGYSRLEGGIQDMKLLSKTLTAIGILASVLILILFGYYFILKQSMRIAIERALGMSKKECIKSLGIGVLSILIIGSVGGSVAGGFISDVVSRKEMEIQYFDRTYGNEMVQDTLQEVPGQVKVNKMIISTGCAASMILVGITVVGTMVKVTLSKPPSKLLSRKND